MVDDGIKTTEFWIAAAVNVAAAIVAILAARGLLSQEEGSLWVKVVEALATVIAPLVMGIVTKAYIDARRDVKVAFYGGRLRQ